MNIINDTVTISWGYFFSNYSSEYYLVPIDKRWVEFSHALHGKTGTPSFWGKEWAERFLPYNLRSSEQLMKTRTYLCYICALCFAIQNIFYNSSIQSTVIISFENLVLLLSYSVWNQCACGDSSCMCHLYILHMCGKYIFIEAREYGKPI